MARVFTLADMNNLQEVMKKLTEKRDTLAAMQNLGITRLNLIQSACAITFENILNECTYEEIGCGERGTCYRCKFKSDCDFAGREFVVKCPLEGNRGTDFFLHEVAVLANIWCIGHPNFVKPAIYDKDGRSTVVIVYNELEIYPVMEVVDGFPLCEVFDNNALLSSWTILDRIWMFVQLAESLRFVHAYGYSHWDLHFGNIMVRDKMPVIIDLGSMANEDVPSGQRADDLGNLWKVFKVMLNDVGPIPPPFCDWLNNLGSRELLPKTISEVCFALGPMGSGTLAAITWNGSTTHVPVQTFGGGYYVDFEQMNLRNEDYCRNIFERMRMQQKDAIMRAINKGQQTPDDMLAFHNLSIDD